MLMEARWSNKILISGNSNNGNGGNGGTLIVVDGAVFSNGGNGGNDNSNNTSGKQREWGKWRWNFTRIRLATHATLTVETVGTTTATRTAGAHVVMGKRWGVLEAAVVLMEEMVETAIQVTMIGSNGGDGRSCNWRR